MSFSQGTASHVVPLLARIVLAAAFIPAGWNKLTGTAMFSPEDAAILRQLGVNVHDVGVETSSALHGLPEGRGAEFALNGRAELGSGWSTAATFQPARFDTTRPWNLSDESTPGADEHDDVSDQELDAPVSSPEHDDTPPPAADASDAMPSPPGDTARPQDTMVPALPEPGPSEGTPAAGNASGGTAGALHRVTLMVHAHGWPLPVLQAWMAVAVELLGGALILVGLFSRLCGLSLASVMGVAFWLTTWPVMQDTSLFALSIPDFNRLFAQAGLFVLAFGVLLTGPGAASIDRLLFPPAGAEEAPPA